ncbi:MAG: 5-formyltetrahydrofolate cyclo-ligase [Candidatus Omnitrophica bacterium]|nr:5-formyltetrahydrofolate cyclo-ligase [Candidatus Omnitrophota bacterium]
MRAKKILRNKMTRRLAALGGRLREQKSRAIAEKLFGLEVFGSARTVCFYAATPREVDTHPMIDAALEAGKAVLVPLCDPKKGTLALYRIQSRKDLKKGAFGIWEPDPGKAAPAGAAEADCVIVPGVAFDKAKNRLGRGKGYYDRFLSGLGPKVAKIGLAFSFQKVKNVPRADHDVPLDEIITD